MQSAVQVLHALHNVLDLILVLGLNLASLTNGHIEGDPNGTLAVGQPAGCRDFGVGHETDTVLSGVGSGEGEAARVVFPLVHDAVIIVEGLLHSNLDLEVVVDRKDAGVRVDNLGVEFAYSWKGDLSQICSHIWLIGIDQLKGRKKEKSISYRLPGCPWVGPRRSTLFGGHQRRNTRRWRGSAWKRKRRGPERP